MNSKISVSQDALQVPPRTKDVDVQIYEVDDVLVSVVVPADYASELENVRKLRADLEKAPANSTKSEELQRKLAEHAFGNRALPEDVLAALESVPRKSIITRIFLADDPGRESHCQTGGGKGVADSSNEHRSIFLFNATAKDLRSLLLHAWAHVAELDCEKERRMFTLAADIEANGFNHRQLPGESESEDWSVHFAEILLAADDDATLETLICNAPLRAVTLAAALKHMIESATGRDRSEFEEVYLRRIKLLESRAMPTALKSLEDILGTNTSEAAIVDAATRLLFYIGLKNAPPALRNATSLQLDGELLTDQNLIAIKDMKNLVRLDLTGTALGRKSLSLLSENRALKWLSLAQTASFDLSPLKQLTELRHLDLSDTPVRDDNLVPLQSLTKLQDLDVTGSDVTTDGVNCFKSYLPDCKVRL